MTISSLIGGTNKPLRVSHKLITLTRALIHSVSLLWLALVYYQALSGSIDGDPVQYLLDFSGIGALHLLMLSLLVSPIAQHFKFQQIMRIRKTLGVYAALYALFHLFVFIAYELQYEWLLILSEIVERPYITVGAIGLVILSSLLFTSFNSIKKRMGQKWQKLHNLAYVALFAICIHYLWSVKSAWYEPAVYIALAVILMFMRREKLKNIFK